jgi:hypothetical protein|tara:strand:+ start:249 stop:1331 length:1083 start_codon:yes stop_codon:yes gene_type:complete
MARYRDIAAREIGEAIGSSDDITTADIHNYMVEGLQYLVNIIPSDMLWNMETVSDFIVDSSNTGINTVDTYSQSGNHTGDPAAVYTDVPLTGGTGSDAKATVTVVENVMTFVAVTTPGGGYVVNDTLTIAGSVIGGSNATVDVATLTGDGIYEGINVGTNKVLYVLRETDNNVVDSDLDGTNDAKGLVECREIPASLRGRIVKGSGWKEEATETDPVWYKYNGKVHIAPESSSINSKAFWVKVPPTAWVADADEQTYMAGTILLELEPLVMAYVVKKCFERKLALAQLGTSTSLEVYVEDEDIDLAQAQQLLIGDLMQTIALKEKALQIGIASFMKGTVEPETAKDMKRVPTYTHLGQQA